MLRARRSAHPWPFSGFLKVLAAEAEQAPWSTRARQTSPVGPGRAVTSAPVPRPGGAGHREFRRDRLVNEWDAFAEPGPGLFAARGAAVVMRLAAWAVE